MERDAAGSPAFADDDERVRFGPMDRHKAALVAGAGMGSIYVARSANFSKWASEVGITKNVFKLGYTPDDPQALVDAGWGGETDWMLIGQREADGVSEEDLIARMARKEKMIDPIYYPRLR